MVSQAIITGIISLSGILIIVWMILTARYNAKQDKEFGKKLKSHHDRIRRLEIDMVEQIVKIDEMEDKVKNVC